MIPITPVLYLSDPHLRYTYASADSRAVPVGPNIGWVGDSAGEWTWSDPALKISVRTDLIAERSTGIKLSLLPSAPVQIGVCAIELLSPAPEPPFAVDTFERWSPLQGSITLNECTPLLIRWRTEQGVTAELRSVRGSIACRLSWRKHWLKALLYIDAAALHPRWKIGNGIRTSTAAPLRELAQKIEVMLLASYVDVPACRPGHFASRYPCGSEACFTLVDHCDFDTLERLKTFVYGDEARSGWIGRGLRMTKSVFTLSSEVIPERRAGCLEDVEYRELITALRRDGSEIAPHALSQAGLVEPEDFSRTLEEFSKAWQAHSWVDHGCGAGYCYAVGGASHPGYRLLERLSLQNFTALWAYHDIPTDARSLNMLAPRRTPLIEPALRHAVNGRLGIALHYLRTALEQRLEGAVRYAVQEVCSALRIFAMNIRGGRLSKSEILRTWSAILRILGSSCRHARLLQEPYTRRELMEMAAVVYPERAVPLSQAGPDEFLLFATAEAPHASDLYTEEALKKHLHERGLHLGHTYLLNELPYISGLFERDRMRLRLKAGWSSFVEALSSAVSRGDLWNPTGSELCEWFRALQQVTCLPCGEESVRISNTSMRDILGFTLLLPAETSPDTVEWSAAPPKGLKSWGDWLAVWGDLPAASEIAVRWGSTGQSKSHESRNTVAILPA